MKAQIVKINPKTIVIKSEGGKFATVNKSEIDFEYKLGDVLIMEKNGDEIYYLPKSAANFQAASDFWGAKQNYIQDGSEDRKQEIAKVKNKKKLSKNRDTQKAINRMIDFGIVLMVGGILEIIGIIFAIILFASVNSGMWFELIGTNVWLVVVELALGIALITSGWNVARLRTEPAGIKSTAVVSIIIGAIFLLFGGLRFGGLLIVIYAIIALVKIGQYEEWYFGEVD